MSMSLYLCFLPPSSLSHRHEQGGRDQLCREGFVSSDGGKARIPQSPLKQRCGEEIFLNRYKTTNDLAHHLFWTLWAHFSIFHFQADEI